MTWHGRGVALRTVLVLRSPPPSHLLSSPACRTGRDAQVSFFVFPLSTCLTLANQSLQRRPYTIRPCPCLRFLRFSRFLRLKMFSVGFFAPKSATEKPQKLQFPHRGNCPVYPESIRGACPACPERSRRERSRGKRSRRANAASPETRSRPVLTSRAKQKSVWKSPALRGRTISYNPFSMSSRSPRRETPNLSGRGARFIPAWGHPLFASTSGAS